MPPPECGLPGFSLWLLAPGWLSVGSATSETGGASLPAAVRGEGLHTAEGRQRLGGPAGGAQSACAICSCLGIGFPSHLLWARLQELSCQTKPGNYPGLIHTFLVYVLIEV